MPMLRKPLLGKAAATNLSRIDTHVRPEWVDYNGHMTDYRYLQVFGEATEALYRKVGVDAAYRSSHRMLYTVDTHIAYLAEVKVNEPLYVTTEVLSVDDKRLKVRHRMYRGGDDKLVATAEQTHLHVNTEAAKAGPMDAALRGRFALLCAAPGGAASA